MRFAIAALTFLIAVPAMAQTTAPIMEPVPQRGVPQDVIPQTATPQTPGATGSDRPRRMTEKERFEAANTTHDGKLTLEQAKAGHMRRVVKNFDTIDAGHKGYVTLVDIREARRHGRGATPLKPAASE